MNKENSNKYIENFRKECKKLEEAQLAMPIKQLDEMATISGKNTQFWFTVTVHSNDHNPPHIHILTKEGEELVKVEITDDHPNTIEDLNCFDWTIPETNIVKKEILKWSKSKNKKGWNYWDVAQMEWEHLHPDD